MQSIETWLEPLTTKLTSWGETAISMIPNAILALIAFGVAWLLSKLLHKGAMRALERLSDNKQVNQLLATVLRVGIIVAGLFIALEVMELEKTVTSLLAGVGVVGLALGFAFQDLAANFMSGVFLAFRRPFRMGDLIRAGDIFGKVEETDLRSTTIVTLTGEHVIVPNRELFEKPLTNYTRTPSRRVDIEVGVSYGEDLEQVEQVTLEALKGVPGLAEGLPVQVVFTGFGGSSIDLVGRVWIDDAAQFPYLKARSEAVKRIKAAYDAAGITIPFPIRTLDFGIKGGQELSESLPAWWGNGEADRVTS